MQLIRLALLHIRLGIQNEMQYRVNFFIQLMQSAVALATGLIGLSLVFSHTTDLGGWTRPELLAVMGVHILMGGVINAAIQPNMEMLMQDIQQGTLDHALTKPADAQVLESVRQFHFWQVVDIIVGAVVMGIAVVELQQDVGAAPGNGLCRRIDLWRNNDLLLLAHAHNHSLLDHSS